MQTHHKKQFSSGSPCYITALKAAEPKSTSFEYAFGFSHIMILPEIISIYCKHMMLFFPIMCKILSTHLLLSLINCCETSNPITQPAYVIGKQTETDDDDDDDDQSKVSTVA